MHTSHKVLTHKRFFFLVSDIFPVTRFYVCTMYTAEKLNKIVMIFFFSKTPLGVQIGLFEKQFCVGKCSTIYGEQRYDIFKIIKVPVKVKKRFQWSTRQVVNGQTERWRNGRITSSEIEILVGPFQCRFLGVNSSLLMQSHVFVWFLPSFIHSTQFCLWKDYSFFFRRFFNVFFTPKKIMVFW